MNFPAIPAEVFHLTMSQRLAISSASVQLINIRTADKDDLLLELLTQLCVKENIIKFLIVKDLV